MSLYFIVCHCISSYFIIFHCISLYFIEFHCISSIFHRFSLTLFFKYQTAPSRGLVDPPDRRYFHRSDARKSSSSLPAEFRPQKNPPHVALLGLHHEPPLRQRSGKISLKNNYFKRTGFFGLDKVDYVSGRKS